MSSISSFHSAHAQSCLGRPAGLGTWSRPARRRGDLATRAFRTVHVIRPVELDGTRSISAPALWLASGASCPGFHPQPPSNGPALAPAAPSSPSVPQVLFVTARVTAHQQQHSWRPLSRRCHHARRCVRAIACVRACVRGHLRASGTGSALWVAPEIAPPHLAATIATRRSRPRNPRGCGQDVAQ